MKDVFGTTRRSWNGLLHGDTIGPYSLRRLIPCLAVAAAVSILNATDVVPWQISLSVLVAILVVRVVWKHRDKLHRDTTAADDSSKHEPARPQPPVAVVEQPRTTRPFEDDYPTDEMKPINISENPAPVPETVQDRHAELYDYHFPRIWLIERIALASVVMFGLFAGAVVLEIFDVMPERIQTWLAIGIVVLLVIYGLHCFLTVKKWSTLRFVVTANSLSMPHSLPWPIGSRTPSIRIIDANYEIRENWLDLILHTCRLISDDKEGTIDDKFHLVKWLPYPDELRIALGKPLVEKSQWFSLPPWLKNKRGKRKPV